MSVNVSTLWTPTAVCALALPSCSSGSGPAGTEPALQGTFMLDYDGAPQLVAGSPGAAQDSTRFYAFRSHCSGDRCVATGVSLHDADHAKATGTTLTLDYVDGRWVGAHPDVRDCSAGGTSPMLVAWTLAPAADGTLIGTRCAATTGSRPECTAILQAPITLARVGDVEPAASVPDPATEPPFSPAAPTYLRGRYIESVTARDEQIPATTFPVLMTTSCVRNTEQCMTFREAPKDSSPTPTLALAFTFGHWSTSSTVSGVSCDDGQDADVIRRQELVLPQPPTDPLQRVEGTQIAECSGTCSGTEAFDILLERTGD